MGAADARQAALPVGAQERKSVPLASGVLDYFPLALAAVAEVSKAGNDQHNPGQPLHWSRDKSTDHADCALRHFVDRGTIDTDGKRHSAKAAWRILAYLECELELAAGLNPFETRPAPDAPLHEALARHRAATDIASMSHVVTDAGGRRISDHADLRAIGMQAAIAKAERLAPGATYSGVPGDDQAIDFNHLSFGGTDE
jgi:hypothetical protein